MPISLEHYVEAAGASSKRSRWVLLALMTASIFGMAGYLSAREGAWPWDRLHELDVVEKCVNGTNPKLTACTPKEVEAAAEMLLRWRYADAPPILDIEHAPESKKSEMLGRLVKERPDLASEVEHHIEHQRDSIMDHTAVLTAPFLGFSFDVNDLGFVATATFLPLLLVLGLSLRREAQNIRKLRAYAKTTGSLATAEDLILMRQVFTIVPPKDDERHPVLDVVSWLNSLLLLLPLAVLSLIMLMDFSTISIGQALSSTGVAFLTTVELVGVIGAFGLIVWCVFEQRGLRGELLHARWKEA